MPVQFDSLDLALPANHYRVHFCGVVYWTCLHCGTPNRRRVRVSTWKAQCTNRLCKRMMMFSAIQEDVPLGWNARCHLTAFGPTS